jgi:cold shock CspA family protein
LSGPPPPRPTHPVKGPAVSAEPFGDGVPAPDQLARPGGLVAGTVSEFDEAVGLGTIEVAGWGPLAFHCTAIADGSRRIEVGTEVLTALAARHLGRYEASGLTPRRPGPR